MTPEPIPNPYDTQERADAALRAIRKCVWYMCELRPNDTRSPEYAAWRAEMDEVNQWAVATHYRLIDINMHRLEAKRLGITPEELTAKRLGLTDKNLMSQQKGSAKIPSVKLLRNT